MKFFAIAAALLFAASAHAQEAKTPLQMVQTQRDQCLSQKFDGEANIALLSQQIVAERKYWAEYVAGLKPEVAEAPPADAPAK